ncbi:MAG: FAD-dependent oxidoreductase, partial [Candidatus Omnitrophica bacterium]|nr:FAD-dependent oxidoreductase [Candidatus Omnitrophota bacterium]
CENIKEKSLSEFEGGHFCSSMPVSLLVLRMNPRPPQEIIKACASLTYRSLVMVYLVLKRKELFKDNWLYIQDEAFGVCRIQNYKNWSPEMIGSDDKTTLGMEYFCSEGDRLWRQNNILIIEQASCELERLNIARREDIVDSFVLRVPMAYPVYKKGYEQDLNKVRSFLSGFDNLYCIGRAGIFRYNNMDHSVLTGFLAAENILGADNNLWDINTDQAYHEELEDSKAE